MTETDEWNTKGEKIQQDFLWALGLEATHQRTRPEYRTDPDNIKIDKTNKTIKQILPTEKKQIQPKRRFLLGKTNRCGDIGRPLGEITRIRKRMRFSEIQHRITFQNL